MTKQKCICRDMHSRRRSILKVIYNFRFYISSNWSINNYYFYFHYISVVEVANWVAWGTSTEKKNHLNTLFFLIQFLQNNFVLVVVLTLFCNIKLWQFYFLNIKLGKNNSINVKQQKLKFLKMLNCKNSIFFIVKLQQFNFLMLNCGHLIILMWTAEMQMFNVKLQTFNFFNVKLQKIKF